MENRFTILAVEDSPVAVQLLRGQLADRPDFELECADCLSAGVARLQRGGVDVVLLDLELPDSHGLDTFTKFYAQAAPVPIVVLTSTDDETQAAKAVQLGAQDYLIKGQVDGNLLARSMRYGIERQRLLLELEESRQREQHERELRSLERAVATSGTPATASMFGQAPLREARPAAAGELVQRYADLIDLALEQRTFKVDHDLSGRLRSLAERMGFLRAVPRDVVEVHSVALKSKTNASPSQKNQAFREEAQFMLLELMGHLCSFYRKYSTGTMAGAPAAPAVTTSSETTAKE